MAGHGDNTTSRASPDGDCDGPKTPTKAEKVTDEKMTQIELTPIESLLFFNMVRFNNHENIDWNKVASNSNLKNAASAKVRFRQILKKHGLMAVAPETPRSQAQKRKAAQKPKEMLDDDEDDDSSYNPSTVVEKTSVRKRSSRGGERAKRQKVEAKTEDGQDDEEAPANNVVAASAPAPKTEHDTESNMKPNPEAKIESGPDDGVAGGIDGTDSASPHDQARAEAPQGFRAGALGHLMVPGHRQSAPPANAGEPQMMQFQPRHHIMVPNGVDGNDSFPFGQQLDARHLVALQAQRIPQLQPQQMTAEQAQLFNRFEAIQMGPYQMLAGDMGGASLPFGYMNQMQMNDQFPADIYNGGVSFFDQAQLGHDVGYGDTDGQDEWDVENRGVTPEVKKEGEVEAENEQEVKLKFEDI